MNIDQEPSELMECPCGDESHAPPAVLDAIADAFPARVQSILADLRRHGSFDDFWSFQFAGMFVGVERDGYIHS